MARITILIGFLMIILGVAGYFMTGAEHKSALIPSYFGILFAVLGAVANAKPSLNKHMMHIVAIAALLAVVMTFRGFISSFTLLTGGEVARPAAVIAQSLLFVPSAVLLGLCIRSFIAARRARIAA